MFSRLGRNGIPIQTRRVYYCPSITVTRSRRRLGESKGNAGLLLGDFPQSKPRKGGEEVGIDRDRLLSK